MTQQCDHVTFAKTFYQPEEYCLNDSEDGSLYCREHDPENGEPDWDDVRKDILIGSDCE